MTDYDYQWCIVDNRGFRFMEGYDGDEFGDEISTAAAAVRMDFRYPDYAPHVIARREVGPWERM